MFELTVIFKHEIIGIWQRFHRNFELTVFELTVPDLYFKYGQGTGREWLIRSHSSARFCFELSGNSN